MKTNEEIGSNRESAAAVIWLQTQIEILKPNGYLVMPLRGLIYQFDKVNKIATLTAAVEKVMQEDTRLITDRILGHLGFRVKVGTHAAKKTLEEFVEAMRASAEQTTLWDTRNFPPEQLETIKKLFD